MDSRDRNNRRVIFKSIFYSTTAICLGFSIWALRYAYLRIDIPSWCWVAIYILIAAYVAWSVISIAKQKRGFHSFVVHSALLQIVPAIASILVFVFVSDREPLTPLTGAVGTYERKFNDMQNKQKAAATVNGLAPFKSREVIESQYGKLRRSGKLVKIESNSGYVVRPLTYSSPYVVPKVERLLDDIAEAFQKRTQSKARFIVTSVLRTEEDIKKLRKVNGNASTNSCHCNATTIDISYVRFEDDEMRPRGNYELRLALAQTLHELREAKRCYVKIERKQYCYHITVR